MTVRHRLTPLTSVAVNVDRRRDNFDLLPERNSESVAISSGLEFNPFALITGQAYVGWGRYRLVDATAPPFTGLVTSLDLGYTLLGATRFTLQGQRDIEYSAIRGQHAYLLAGFRSSVTHRLGSGFDIGAGAARYRLSYGLFSLITEPGGEIEVPGFADTSEIVTEHFGEVGYRVGRQMRIGFRAARQHRRSTVARAREYESVRAGMSINYRF